MSGSWDSLLISEIRILECAKKLFAHPTQIQIQSIPKALQGHDILGKAKTGSGKTAAYIIPILVGILHLQNISYSTLVLVPTKELCKQVKIQFENLASFTNIPISALSDDSFSQTLVAKLSLSTPAVLIGTPARIYSLNNIKTFLSEVKFFVIDEADQQFGLNHESDIIQIIKELPQCHQSFLMSATLGDKVEQLQSLVLNNPVRIEISDDDGEKRSHYYFKVSSVEEKFLALFTMFLSNSISKRCLIFANSNSMTYKLRLFLEEGALKSTVLNAKLPIQSRLHIIEEFNKGNVDIVIATDEESDEFIPSRGIDFKRVPLVINFDFPTTVNQYIHRVGRTARGRGEGVALSFVNCESNFQEVYDEVLKTESEMKEFRFDMDSAKDFTVRVDQMLTLITKLKIKKAEKQDLKREMENSEILKGYFDENPPDLKLTKHDSNLLPSQLTKSFRIIPSYLGKNLLSIQNPLTQKAREAKMEQNKFKRQLANMTSINAQIKKLKSQKKPRKRKNS